ncbi:MAG: cyclodeaminase/cyclohydrolase family protein [Clostridiales bacterium]|nr:cyclodeaminase/cyclohydrolase family protein [Clostridiales bacterium]
MKNKSIVTFTGELCSNAPVPGGGGASALMGAVSASLCSMVGELTTGKKKYAEYQTDIERILGDAKYLNKEMLDLMQKDADAFEPLSKAYGIPKDDPEREDILEAALVVAAQAPFDIVIKCREVASLVEELVTKGSRLAISDVGVAAAACRAAATGAAMNVYINTKLMKNREYADKLNSDTNEAVNEIVSICDKAYEEVYKGLES